MLGDITASDEICIVCGYTDMRRAIDGLCAIVLEIEQPKAFRISDHADDNPSKQAT